jgi:hypothetical protein
MPDRLGKRISDACCQVKERSNIVLWNAAADSIPAMPSFTRPLTHPLVSSITQAAAAEIGYRIL